MSITMFDTFGGGPAQPAYSNYILITLPTNLTLSWPIQFQTTNNVVFNWMDVEPVSDGFTLTLPDATITSPGMSFFINNPTEHSFTVNKNDGTFLYTANAGTESYFVLYDNTTQGGSWRIMPGIGVPAVTSVNATSISDNLVITGVPITSAGTINFDFANDLRQLSTFGNSTGISYRSAPNTWQLISLVGTDNQISVSPVAANAITFALEPNIRDIVTLGAGDLLISTNTISTVNANEPLSLAPNNALVKIGGLGLGITVGQPIVFFANNNTNFVSLEAGSMNVNYLLTWPTVAPADNQVLQYTVASNLIWANVTTYSGSSTANAIARFANTSGTLANSSVFLDTAGNITGATSLKVGDLTIGGNAPGISDTISTNSLNANLYLSPNGSGNVVLSQNTNLNFISGNDINFFGILANSAMTADVSMIMPATLPLIGQTMAITNVVNPKCTAAFMNFPSNPNILANGNFMIWQRGTSFTNATVYPNNDGQYIADRWKLLSSGNNIVNVAQTAVINGSNLVYASNYAITFTVATANQKFGICQIIEAAESIGTRTCNLYLSCGINSNALTDFKMAVIGWTGPADAPTSNPISAWNATGVDPTLAANWVYQGTTFPLVVSPASLVFSRQVTIANNVNNLGVIVWCDTTTTAIGNILNIFSLGLTFGPLLSNLTMLGFEAELKRCKRYFQKDFPYFVAPFTAATQTTKGTFIVSPINAAVTVPNDPGPGVLRNAYARIEFENEMSGTASPTIVVYPYTTVTSINCVSDNTGGDQNAGSATVIFADSKGFKLTNSSGAGIMTTGYFLGHYTASTEF